MNVLQHKRNELNLCLQQNRPDRSYRDTLLTLCPAYQEKRSTLFEYLNKEYRISVNRMAPDDNFLLLINPPSKNKPVQKLIAKYVFDCYEKRRSLVV